MLLNIVAPMLAASPKLPLRLLTVSAGTAWDNAWAAAIGGSVYATSFHDGCKDLDACPSCSNPPCLSHHFRGVTRRLTRSHDCVALFPAQTYRSPRFPSPRLR